jgi:hypothetical protein
MVVIKHLTGGNKIAARNWAFTILIGIGYVVEAFGIKV